jgi:hypothetical protein
MCGRVSIEFADLLKALLTTHELTEELLLAIGKRHGAWQGHWHGRAHVLLRGLGSGWLGLRAARTGAATRAHARKGTSGDNRAIVLLQFVSQLRLVVIIGISLMGLKLHRLW